HTCQRPEKRFIYLLTCLFPLFNAEAAVCALRSNQTRLCEYRCPWNHSEEVQIMSLGQRFECFYPVGSHFPTAIDRVRTLKNGEAAIASSKVGDPLRIEQG